jgi:diguanylate cyclase (GGDEF)-like protein
MLRVVSCLTTQHDWRLVILAAVVCFLASFAAINLFHRSQVTTGHTRFWWLMTTAIAGGYGIWATHFIAMLAFEPGLPVGYDLLMTLKSLLSAVIITGAGFSIVAMSQSRLAASTGGAVFGLGVAVMHFTGMNALEMPGRIVWSMDLVVASIILGVTLGIGAIVIAAQSRSRQAMLISALLLSLAILALHLTAMGAVEIIPDPTIAYGALSLSSNALAIGIAGAAAAVLTISLVVAHAAQSRQLLIEIADAQNAMQVARLETAIAHMSQGLSMYDENKRIVIANDRYAQIYGLRSELLEPGTSLRTILEARVENGVYDKDYAQEIVEKGLARFHDEVNEVIQLTDGRYISVLCRPTVDGGQVSTHEDITDRRLAEERITYLAHHDVLTDLPNRALLREKLEWAISAMNQGDRALAVLLLDLDRFKVVNDTLGHPVGDRLLQAVTERLRACVNESDTVGRLGGDEFAIVLRTLDPGKDSVALAQNINEAISAPFDLGDHHVHIGTSIGIAIAPQDGDTPDALLKNADLALYRAKSDRAGAYYLFEPELDRRMQDRRALELDLRNALVNDEFIMHYQPLVNLQEDEICGFEALVRWNHPVRGLVPPSDFILLAEETGFIIPLGEWILEQACTDAAGWPDHLKIAVNISPAQFEGRNLTETIMRILAATGLPPHRLELEITESVMLQDEQVASKVLNELHALGIRLALDDFGTGFSSLSSLRKFPFDKIKIDRSFVSDLSLANVDALAVVRSVAQLGVSLGMATTAEGVETQEQMDHVRAEGCTEMQGFYICRPSTAKDISKLIKDKCRRSASAA